MKRPNNDVYKFFIFILITALVITIGMAAGTGNNYIIVDVTKGGVAQADKTVWVSYYDSVKQANVSGRSTTWADGQTLQIPIPAHVKTIYVQVDNVSYKATIGNVTTTTVYIRQ